MKLSKRILACAVTAAMATSMLSACNGSSTTSGTTNSDGSSQANSTTAGNNENPGTSDNSSTGGNSGNVVEAPSNGTTLKWLGYYDLNTDDKEIVDKFGDEGYTVEYISTSSTE